ncbi:MAG TPA: ABC transporter permease, partial [Afipia sp.]
MTSNVQNRNWIQSVSLAVFLIVIWEGSCRFFGISSIVLPTPSSTIVRLYEMFSTGTIWPHLWATLIEVLAGFVLGCVAGLVAGALISLIPIFERLIYPYLVALQTLPKVAIAPLFIIWFGYGLTSKIVITA